MQKTGICAACALFIIQYSSVAQTTAPAAKPDAGVPGNATVVPEQPEFIPMTGAERFRQYFKDTFTPVSLLGAAAGAGVRQAENTPHEWGQGARGYGLRIGNGYAGHIMRSTMMSGAAAVLHEDNRYIRSGQTGVGPRLKYAIASTFLARRDDGTRRVSFSRIGGTAGTAFVSRIWQPHSTNKSSDAISSFGISIGTQTGFNIAREFWPFHRHGRDAEER